MTTPFCRPPDERPPLDLPADVVLFAEEVDRDELRGDLAAEVFAAADVFVDLVPFPFDEEERVGFLLLPLGVVFDLADVVLRAEDDLELPVFDVPADRDPPRDELLLDELLLDAPPREEPADLPAPVVLRLVAAAPFLPAALFFAVVLVELLDDPPAELFELLPDDLRFVAAAPFLPAALF